MFRKIEHRVFRDPVHGYIHVNHQIVWDCINTKEFQRLRRIKQLGASFQVYPTAEHSRFSHSLGVYEVCRRMLTEVDDLKNNINDYDKTLVLLASLLHDVGHGPFSHTFEAVSKIDHEEYSEMIILGNSEVNKVLKQVDDNLPEEIASIINHTHKNKLLSQIVSSQLDADRMDYLLRDAYFTGTSYGSFDLNRILRTMKVVKDKIVVKESGVHAVEDYIMARYHMYWNVYFHPVSRSYEAILTALFKRMNNLKASDLMNDYPLLKEFLNEKTPNISSHFILDEALMLYYFNKMQSSKDKVLSDLAKRLLNRKLFGYKDFEDMAQYEEICKLAKEQGYDPIYYVYKDNLGQTPYSPYSKDTSSLIYILNKNNEVVELSKVSEIVSAISAGKEKSESKIFFPKEIEV
ncbi:MAG: HD domain-containing protein [Erysipelothrix sp.]|nr:HD domain-containing protein [Erysipelothrix sp.]